MKQSLHLRQSLHAPVRCLAIAIATVALAGCEQRSTTVQTPNGSVTTTTLEPTSAVRQELNDAASAASAALGRAGPVASRVLDQAQAAATDAASQVRESASSGALARAGDVASSVMGRAGDAAADAAVTAKVKAALLADSRVKGMQIDVGTHGHAVTLTGNAESQPGLDAAVEIARRVDGVKSVESRTAAR